MVTVLHAGDIPSVGLVTLEDILGEGNVSTTVNGDVVVVINDNQTAELEVAGNRGSLVGNSLLQTTISAESVNVVVDNGETLLVEGSGQIGLSNSHTDGIAHTLSQRTSANLHSSGLHLGMARSAASELAEVLQIIHRKLGIKQRSQGIHRIQ